ncbi:T-cell surface glycoprotein CD8 beta chain-like isoform X2 [Mobula hypostoma]|uniref:T-cell surface glycoprotein CD8 beta chain-like isoform X2 n=1 Tax=Mobula hypostoma TaxID=723540 RepID=UPI002FC3B2F6
MWALFVSVLLQNCVQCSYLIIQPALSQPVRLGDTVTLTCLMRHKTFTVYSNVYWMRQQNGKAPTLLAYSFLNSRQTFLSDGLSNTSSFNVSVDSQSLNLTITKVTPSDAGIYLCAGWSLGKLSFGNGTKLTLTGFSSAPSPTSSSAAGTGSPQCWPLSSLTMGLLVLAAISLLVLLAALVYITQRKTGWPCTRPAQQAPVNPRAAHRENPAEDEIHYASMSLSPAVNRKDRVECNMVYAEVRQDHL